MKKFFCNILILLSFVLLPGFITQQNEKIFVGYKNDLPVFYEYRLKKLFVLKDDKPKLLQEIHPHRHVCIVKDDFIVYEHTDALIISDKGKETTYPIHPYVCDINKDGTLYFNKKDSIYLAKNGRIELVGLQGTLVSVEGNKLYYNVNTSNSLRKAKADLFVYDIKTKTSIKVASGISGLKTVVFPDGKHVFDFIKQNGLYEPAIYNTVTHKFQTFEVEVTEKFHKFNPYYSHKDNCVLFYDPVTLETIKITIPTDFPLTVEDY